MPWVYYWGIDPDTGQRVRKRRWVAEPAPLPPKKKTGGKSSSSAAAEARRRAAAAAAARRRAEAAAAARRRAALTAAAKAAAAAARAARIRQQQEYAKKLADARRSAYERLKSQQSAAVRRAGLLRSEFINSAPKKPSTAPPPAGPAGDALRTARRGPGGRVAGSPVARGQALIAQAEAAKAAQAQKDWWAAYAEKWRRQQALKTGKAGDAASAQEIEKLLAEEAARSKGGTSSTKYVEALREKYEEHALAVYERYEDLVSQINAALDSGDIETARKLYYGGAFQGSQAEFVRLFGKGDNPLKDGTYSKFYQGYQQIGQNQRDWWKSQMAASLESEIRRLRERDQQFGTDHSAEIERLRRQWALFNRDAGRTIEVIDPDTGKKVRRTLSLEEELDRQRALIIMKQEQLAAERGVAEKRRKALLMAEGLTSYKGSLVKNEELDLVRSSERLVATKFGGKAPSFKTPEDLQGFADELVRDWTRQHPPPKVRARGGSSAYNAWLNLQREYERRVYSFFGSGVPQWWDRLFTTPGVSHGLAILQGLVAGTGAGARALNAAVFGESKVGGFQPDLGRLPPGIQAKLDKLPPAGSTGDGGRAALIRQFLSTESGIRWARADLARQRQESGQEDLRFAGEFYGAEGDIGSRLRALNEYGSNPTANPGANLLFQLLADPTNAIPLKFTTYLARGKYALEASKGKGAIRPLSGAKSFLTVDEGTLAIRKALSSAEKELKKLNLTPEQAADMWRERAAGVKQIDDLKDQFHAFYVKVGLDPKKVSEAQLFNLIERSAAKRAEKEGVEYLTQADELKVKIDTASKRAEDAAKAARKKSIGEQAKLDAGMEVRVAAGKEAQVRLSLKREQQEALLKEKSAVVQAGAAPVAAKRAPQPPARNPDISGATDNAVSQAQTRAISRKVRSGPKYRVEDEFFKTDSLGNRLPVQFVPDDDYRRLLAAARKGDIDAREQLINRARYERNLFRMEQEDLLGQVGLRRRDVKFRPTAFDFAERAGTVSDEVATARLIRDRRVLRTLRGRAARGNADDYVRGFTRKGDAPLESEGLRAADTEWGDLRGQVVEGRLAIGDDVLDAQSRTLRGTKGLYETFSHDALKHYDGYPKIFRSLRDPKFVKKMTIDDFQKYVGFLEDLPVGSASFRDGGQWLFEVFHQLRLARDWDKLREFSDFMGVVVRDEPTSIFGWMWKTMEERSVLPYSMHIDDIRQGFYQAAEAWNLHPELAFSTIPSGYYAQNVPVNFGLSPRLEGLADSTSDLFDFAPRGYTKEAAKDEITRMFLGGSGSPSRVVHYTSERYGDFVKGGEIAVRMKDELTHAAALAIGPDELARVLDDYADALAPDFRSFAERRGVEPSEFIRRELTDFQKKWGRTTSRPRPEYKGFRDAVEAAYWAGRLPKLNGRVHTTMLLARLQTDPSSWLSSLRVYLRYMKGLGGEDFSFAKRLIHELYDGEIKTDVARAGAGVKALSSQSRIALWREFELFPADQSLLSYAAKRVEKADALEREFADEASRASWLAEDSAAPRSDYTGEIDTLNFTSNVKGLVEDLRAGKKVEGSLEGTIRSFMSRMLDNGSASFDQATLDSLRDAVAAAAKYPEARRVIRRVQEDLGFRRLEEIKAGNPDLWAARLSRARDEAAAKNLPEAPVRYEGAAPAETASRSVSEQLYEEIFQMSEREWLAWEKARAYRVLNSKASTAARKNEARQHILDIEAAEFVIKYEKSAGTYIPWRERSRFQRRVLALYGDEIEKLVAPRMISPFTLTAYDAAVEQGRTYWRLLQSAAAGPVPSRVRGIIHKGSQIDHIPKNVWDDVEQRVSDAIADARGYRADTRTRARRRGRNEESQRPLGKLSDSDPIVIKAKQKALADYARETGTVIPIDAYDEARKVLWKGYVQNRTSKWLLSRAKRIVARTGADLEKTFIGLRAKEARIEARRQLGALAYREMYGHDPASIVAEFTRRYSDDGMLRHFTPELTPFQRSTLTEHVKSLSGLDQLDDRIGLFLQSANLPPLHSRELTRDFLTKTGAWSPRAADDFVRGARSWSIWDEAEYWRTAYGQVPEWTDPRLLGTELNRIFHDEGLYYRQMKEWGIFSRSQELKLRLDGVTAQEIEKAALEGDATLGIKGRRELDLQRKYVIERYGSLVSKDGRSLDAMPWLMYPEEYRYYLSKTSAKDLPEGMIQSSAELDEVTELIQIAMEPFWQKYVVNKVDGSVTYHDIFRVAAEVQAQLLANPKWARRHRDIIGSALNRWAWFNRWLVFSNPSFLVTNVVDAPIKGMYYRLTRRGLFDPELARGSSLGAELARVLTPESIGLDATTAMYRVKQASALSRLRNPRGFTPLERAVDRALAAVDGTGELFPAIAGRVEQSAQMRLARGMYPKVFDEALKRFGNADMAQAFSAAFVKKEVRRMWPSAGDGPIQRLWNRVTPFGSYNLKNKTLFISEAIGHPILLNYIQRIGDYIEDENLRNWERDHPGTEMPGHLRRQIELPWAKGYYLDLSTFSDAARGLKPIFDMGKTKSVIDWTAQWVRLVNPGAQALVYSILNAMNVANKTQWVAVLDANGYPTGSYTQATTGWLEPWSNRQADLGSVFWFAEAAQSASALGIGGWTSGELSQIIGQVAFFNGISTYDRGAVYATFYFSLREKNKAAADLWLQNTEQGQYLQDWFEAKSSRPREVIDRLRDMERAAADPASWFHSQTPEFQERVRSARDEIRRIRDLFAVRLAALTPGTEEYRIMKAQMYVAINDIYLNTPELMATEVYGKSAREWSQQLAEWQTDKLMDDFMALSGRRPSRGDYDSTKEYNAAVADWNTAKKVFLNTYPQVAERLNKGRGEFDSVRDKIEKEWDEILGRIAARNERIDVAREILDAAGRDSVKGQAAQDRLDALYLANELDYTLLERDYAATFFSPDDFEKLPAGVLGPAVLRGNIIKRVTVFLDFDRARYEKARREGTLDDFLAQQKYGEDMRAAIRYAKGGDPFGEFDGKKFYDYIQSHPDLRSRYFDNNPGKEAEWTKTAFYVEGIRAIVEKATKGGKFDPATFVRLLKANPKLLAEYFRRHPGKKELWARTDAYIRAISVWGRLAAAGRWDEANAAWDRLPQWVKDEYNRKHPGRGQRAQKTSQYLGYMKKWVSLFDQGDRDAAMRYFHSLPGWVKERYYSKHPDKRAEFELEDQMAEKLRQYFAGDKESRADFLRKNPDLARWLAQNGGSEAAERAAIIAAYRSIPKEEAWLRRVFRERYPEVFSQEAIGERRLKKVFDTLSQHPEILPDFEEWVEAIWASYAEMLKHGASRPLSSYFEIDRKVPARKFRRSKSAAETSK